MPTLQDYLKDNFQNQQYVLSPLTAIPALLLAYHVLRVNSSPISKLPGPWYTKWTALFLVYHWLRGNRPRWVHKLHQQYGPVVRIAPNEVDITDINAVKIIYSQREIFVKEPVLYRSLKITKEHNIATTSDVTEHRQRRRLLGGPMSESSLKAVEQAIVEHIETGISRMKEECAERGYMDVFKWFSFIATDLIGYLTFGESFQTLQQKQDLGGVKDMQQLAFIMAVNLSFPKLTRFAGIFPVTALRNAIETQKRLRSLATKSLDKYQELLASEPDRVARTFFTRLLQAKDEEKLDQEELLAEATAFLVGGTDTTSNALTQIVWQVCRHPEVKAALMEELKALPEEFSDDDLKDISYLRMVIDETLRLGGVFPSSLLRVVPADGAELAGYWFDPGTIVGAQTYSMHHDPDIWPDPEIFNPGRWQKPTQQMKDAFMPFGRGPRICLGLHLAYMELRRGTARFFQEFPHAKISSAEGMSEEDMQFLLYFLAILKGQRCLIDA